MRPPGPDSGSTKRRATALLSGLLVAAASVVVCLALLEIALRLFPALLPSGVYGSGVRHPELGMNVYGTRVIYNKVRLVTREPNREGFLDVDHVRAKPAGAKRVGFFGDSYVEAYQVPLDTVFYRQLGAALAPAVETLGFGMSGWGTAQALAAFRVFQPAYELDAAIYVFVENDLGDQFYELGLRTRGRSSPYPFYTLDGGAPDGFRERWLLEPGEEPLFWKLAKVLQRHSLLAHVVRERLALLATQGVELRADRDAEQMSRVARGVPLSTDLPGSWPAVWASPAKELGRRVLGAWAREARQRNVRLAVLYVPRSEDQLRGRIAIEDTWKPWLEATCAAYGIPLLDPSDALRARLEAGDPVYDDHWTPAGHEVIAQVLADALPMLLAKGG